MSTAGRTEAEAPAASDIAARLRSAGFVRLVADQTGDAIAASGLLAGVLSDCDVPYQTSVTPLPEQAVRATDADLTVAVGRPAACADLAVGLEGPASQTAYEVASELGRADIVLALAGVVAAGRSPDDRLLGVAQDRGIERSPGVAVPTDELSTGLAYSTLLHAPFSGSVEAVSDTLDVSPERGGFDEDGHRRVASMVALTVAGDEQATTRASTSVERFLRPHQGSQFGTVGGYADVLGAAAHERPDLAVALSLGGGDTDAVRQVWQRHGTHTHEAVREARTGRYDGLFVARCEGTPPVGTVARLVRDFRSPEPVVLVVGDGVAAMQATQDAAANVGTAISEAATSVGGDGAGTRTRGRARFDCEQSEFVLAAKEPL